MSMLSSVEDLTKKVKAEKKERLEKQKLKKQEMISVVVCCICRTHKKGTLRKIKGTKGYICSECFSIYSNTYLQHNALKKIAEREQHQKDLLKKESLIIKPTTNELINVSTGRKI